MAKLHLGLLTLGAFLIIVALCAALWILEIIQLVDLAPLVLLFSGIWVVVLAGLKSAKPSEDGAFSTFGWGMLFIVLGGSLYLTNLGLPIEFTAVFVLLLLGALAVAAGIRLSRK